MTTPNTQVIDTQVEPKTDTEKDISKQDDKEVSQNKIDTKKLSNNKTNDVATIDSKKESNYKNDSKTFKYKGKKYKIIKVDSRQYSPPFLSLIIVAVVQ